MALTLIAISWFGIAGFGIWLYGGLGPKARWYNWLLAFSLGWLWLIPIGLYPLLKSDGMI